MGQKKLGVSIFSMVAIKMFIEQMKGLESECEIISEVLLLDNNREYVMHWEAFDKLFQHLYLVCCCHWGCHEKGHVFERLGGKSINNIAVARRAMLQGYYDESLSLIRTVGEIANLLNLFWLHNEKIQEWLDVDERIRIRQFGPAAVRKVLADSGWLVPFSEKHYKYLCETSVHPTPSGVPNAYSNELQPVLGCVFQEDGLRFCFWNLLWSLSVVAGPIAKLANLERSKAEELIEFTVPVFTAACENLKILNES